MSTACHVLESIGFVRRYRSANIEGLKFAPDGVPGHCNGGDSGELLFNIFDDDGFPEDEDDGSDENCGIEGEGKDERIEEKYDDDDDEFCDDCIDGDGCVGEFIPCKGDASLLVVSTSI